MLAAIKSDAEYPGTFRRFKIEKIRSALDSEMLLLEMLV
jgi:hypothetical protein